MGKLLLKGKRFRWGHNGRLLNDVEIERRKKISVNLKVGRNTPEYKKYLSKRSSMMWKNEDYREKHKIGMERALSNPEVRKKLSENSLKMWKERTPEQRKNVLKNSQSPSAKRKRSVAVKRNHELGIYDKSINKMLAYWDDPNHRMEKSERAKQQWQDPKFRKRFSRIMKNYYKDPVFKQNILKNLHTPEVYAKRSGENSPLWRGGVSLNPYPKGWTKNFKKEIKLRDGYKCSLCGRKKILCVHHVDYIKHNLDKNNLITLCRKCHSKTNNNREVWVERFNHIFVERGINAGS